MPVKFKSISSQLYDYLSNEIFEGKIEPGERLLEKKLAEEFDISRAPIRECFRIMESQGLIIMYPRKGAVVKRVTLKEIKEVIPVRISLDILAAKLAVPNITNKDIEILNELILEMEKAISENDNKEYLRINFVFHHHYIKASHNSVLERSIINLEKALWYRISYMYFTSLEMLTQSNKTHKAIVKAFKQKDLILVEKLIRQHIEYSEQYLLKSFPLQTP
jgi:DNA-binding GntR family transcriptional regulator